MQSNSESILKIIACQNKHLSSVLTSGCDEKAEKLAWLQMVASNFLDDKLENLINSQV